MLSVFIHSFIYSFLILPSTISLSVCLFCVGHIHWIPMNLLACHPFKCFRNSQAIHRRQNHIIARESWMQHRKNVEKKHSNWKVRTTLGTVTISKATEQSQHNFHKQLQRHRRRRQQSTMKFQLYVCHLNGAQTHCKRKKSTRWMSMYQLQCTNCT